MTIGEIIIIGLLLFLIVSYYIGGGTTTSNQGFILEKIAELKKELKELKQKQAYYLQLVTKHH